ncbi:hypothetical protein LAZ67_4001594 [Cordylochernes scorpioides]|uniref:Uncharacterized protein n=1 Tax=Cordylochernes scorpioides TaxID=51811 RepID=A0ABY6KCC7_9ARAC|nr:hypothetical protein LAZ67_4001594 [Cordylochernes scorpioides]
MNVLEVADAIKEGAEVNARNKLKKTPLHIASHKGDNEIVALLLQNKADPQMSDINEYTPLHYAAEASNLKMVEALLSHGAIYNATTMDGATPCKFASDEKIVFLLNLLEDSFRHIKNGSEQVISDLKILKDVKQVRAVMCANNRDHETLIVCAIKTNFPKVNCLKEILQENVSGRIDHARNLIGWCRYRESIDILMSIHEERREILGPENPGTWDIQYYIALGLYNQGSILEALGIVTDIYKKRRDTLGTDAEDTLRTRSLQASMLYSLKQDDEALSIFKEIYPTHKKLLGVNHEVVVDNLLHIGVILEAQEKYDEALKIYEELYQLRKETLGGDAPVTLSAQNKIAIILHKQGKYEKTLKVLQEVYERRKVVFGEEHTVTLETLKNIGSSFMWQRKVHEALKVFKDLLTIQKKVFGPMDYYTLSTQSLLGSIYASQGKWSSAQVEFTSCLDQMKYVYAQNHPSVMNILKKLEMVQMALKKQVDQYVDATQGLQDFSDMATNTENRQGVGPTVKSSVGKNKSPDQLYPLHHAVIMGNLEAVNVLLKDGTNANSRDSEGRTPLHHAVDKSNTNIVKILKQHGADVTLATNEGSTSLHTAAIKRAQEIAELLLKDLPPKNLKYFVNAKTSVRGMTALHISAERGYVEMVLILLSHGAVYNIPDKQGNTPVDLSIDKDIVVLLSLIDELFNDAKIGNMDILGKLKLAKPVLFNALANSRNHQGNTLLQVAIANKNKNLAVHVVQAMIIMQFDFALTNVTEAPTPKMEYKRCSSCIPGLGALTGYYQPGQLSQGSPALECWWIDDGLSILLYRTFHRERKKRDVERVLRDYEE